MPRIEEYLERAPELAQEIVNPWGVNLQAGNATLLTDDFRAVFDKACRYRDEKSDADNHRGFHMLSESDIAKEEARRQAFAEAYKTYWEKHNTQA